MGDEFTITCTAYPYNMANWCVEKSSFIVQELAKIADILNREDLESDQTKEQIRTSLICALHDATKLLSFSCGAEWAIEDRERIMKQGSEGFKEICREYGVDKHAFYEIKYVRDFVAKCKSCLGEKRAGNRSDLHALFEKRVPDSPHIRNIYDELEKVTMGESEWPDFVCHAQNNFEEYLAQLDAKEAELKKKLRNPFAEYACVPSGEGDQ